MNNFRPGDYVIDNMVFKINFGVGQITSALGEGLFTIWWFETEKSHTYSSNNIAHAPNDYREIP